MTAPGGGFTMVSAAGLGPQGTSIMRVDDGGRPEGPRKADPMRRSLVAAIVAILLAAAAVWTFGLLRRPADEGADTGTGAGTAVTEEETALYDGPYVFWSGETVAYVGSICGDSAVFETVEGEPGEPMRFTDPCAPEDTYEIDPAPPTPDPEVVAEAGRIFAVSDVEGNPDELRLLLRAAGVIDGQDRWAWGDGRLVFVGDMVDRGDQVTEELWWVHQLEPQALAAGGRVHVVLGNHDAMLMYNDDRYAADKYKLVAPKFRASLSGLYGPRTELGRWLRSKPAMLRIGDLLFVHGGVSEALAQSGLDIHQVNEAIRLGIDEPWRTRAPGTYEMLFGADGPLWYRGYFNDEELGPEPVARALATFGARTVVVGHTIVDEVQMLHGGLVIGVDVTFTDADEVQGLLIEDGRFYRVDGEGGRTPLGDS